MSTLREGDEGRQVRDGVLTSPSATRPFRSTSPWLRDPATPRHPGRLFGFGSQRDGPPYAAAMAMPRPNEFIRTDAHDRTGAVGCKRLLEPARPPR